MTPVGAPFGVVARCSRRGGPPRSVRSRPRPSLAGAPGCRAACAPVRAATPVRLVPTRSAIDEGRHLIDESVEEDVREDSAPRNLERAGPRAGCHAVAWQRFAGCAYALLGQIPLNMNLVFAVIFLDHRSPYGARGY